MTKAKAKTLAAESAASDREEEDLIGNGPVPASDRKVTKEHNGEVRGNPNTAAAKQLRSFIERIERLIEDRKSVQDDISQVFQEAKGQGYDSKLMRRAIRDRAKDKAERQEEEALYEVYQNALGLML